MNRELNVFTLRMLRDQYHAEHLDTEAEALEAAISALEQPELIEQGAYVRGFEQGRTQGMLDAKLQPTCNQLATDCISRQAAIEDIRTMIPKDAQLDIKWIEMWLMQLPSAQPEPQWIPCSERLPENGRQVLVYARSVHYALAKHDEMREADGTYKKQWVTFDAWKPFYTIKDVIAWCELPEPWRGER